MGRIPSNAHLVAKLQTLSRSAAAVAIAVGCLVIVGWLFQIESFKSVLPGLVTMRFNTALVFTLAGIGLFNLRSQPTISRVAAITVIVLAVLNLSQYLFGWNLGIDQLFVQDTSAPTSISIPGRMSLITAVNFCLVGSALLLLTWPRHYWLAHTFTLTASFFALLALLGYLYSIEPLYRVVWFTSVALHTAVTLLVLCLGILVAHPDQGLSMIFSVNSAGGYIARRLLPVVALISIGVGWLWWQGELREWYGRDFAVVLFTLSTLVILSVVTMRIAHILHTTDMERQNALDRLRMANEQLELRVEQRTGELLQANRTLEQEVAQRKLAEERFQSLLEAAPDALIIVDEQGRIVLSNAQATNLFGYTTEELLEQPVELIIPEPFRSRHTAHRADYMVDPHVRGMGIGLELFALRKDGSQFPVEISLSPIETEEGMLIVSAIRDVTYRHRMEAILQAERNLLRTLIDTLPDHIYVKDRQSRWVMVNQATMDFFGVSSANELIGKSDFDFHSREVAEPFYFDEQAIIESGTPLINKEETNVNAQGKLTWISTTKVPWHDPHGQVIGIIGANRDITEHKQTEERLAAEHNLLRTLIDALPDYIFVKDVAGRFVVSNMAHAQAVQVSNPDDLVGKVASDVFPSALAAQFDIDDHAVMQSGEPLISQERQTINSAGEMIWVSSTKVPLRDTHNQVVGLVGISRDITQHRQMEEQIAKARDFYRTLLEVFPALVWQAGIDTQCYYFNRSWLAFTGRALEQEIGNGWAQGVHPEDYERCLETYLNSFEARQPFIMEYRLRHHSGSYRWIVDQGQPFLDLDGEFAGYIGACYDIDERRQAEEALRESEERYRALFNEIDDAIFIHDPESNILDVNQAACDRLGYSCDELLSMKTIDIDAPDYAAKFYERLQYQLRAGKLLDIEGVHVARDGRHIPIHVNSRKITYKGHDAILAVARDVTELRRAERQAAELAVEKTRVKLLAEFIRDISHDFRTPLTVIGSNAYLLFRSTEPEKRQRHFDGIQLQIKQLANLLERLLLMARLDNQGTLELQPLQVESLMKHMEARFGQIAQEKGITFMSELLAVSPTIHVDNQQIVQAVGEIVDNAIAFTAAGGTVTIRADVADRSLVIEIQDTGVGIQPEDLPHIFRRLYRADKARSTERGAVGLGLSIAERIIHGHGGHIEVESKLGMGSTFRVYLPLSGLTWQS